jgi:hypothetical protein
MHEIGTIVAMLAGRAEDLARELLPGGRREGREWVCGDLTGAKGRGVSVCIAGPKAGVWGEFSAGRGGDALDLVAVVRFGGDKGEALRWARQWLGLGSGTQPGARVAPPAPDRAALEAQAAQRLERGKGLWLAGAPILGTPAERYLATRGIDLAALGRAPAVLRFHPAAWCGERAGEHPAMIALIQDRGRTIGAHRTYLAPDGRGKARIRAAKKVLGSHKGGLIPLWRGASDAPLAAAPAGEVIAIAEGIEDALTVALHCPEWRVVACVNIGNMGELTLPPAIAEVRLCFDRDGENLACAAARQRAIRRYQDEGRRVFEMRPPEGFKDLNDWHMAEIRRQKVVA